MPKEGSAAKRLSTVDYTRANSYNARQYFILLASRHRTVAFIYFIGLSPPHRSVHLLCAAFEHGCIRALGVSVRHGQTWKTRERL